MGQNVSYYWILVLVNPLCLSHFICNVNHCISYQNLLLPHKEYRVGNDQYVGILFIIQVIVDIHGHRF